MLKTKIFICCFVLFLVGGSSPGWAQNGGRGLRTGDYLPRMLFRDGGGKIFNTSSARGKIVVLNLTAGWHPPCRSQAAVLNDLAEKYRGEGLMVISLFLDDDTSSFRRFLAEARITYRAVLANARHKKTFGSPRDLPAGYLIDRDGQIRFRFTGYTPQELWYEKIQILLAEK